MPDGHQHAQHDPDLEKLVISSFAKILNFPWQDLPVVVAAGEEVSCQYPVRQVPGTSFDTPHACCALED